MRKGKICCLQDRSHNSRITAYPNTHHIHSVSVKWRWFKYLCGGNSIYASCSCNDSCSTYGTAEKTDQMHNLRCFALLLIFFLLTECIVQMNLCFGLFQLYLDYQLFFFRLSSEELSFHLLCQTKSSYHYAVGYPMAFPHNH